jgi:RNA polymerase sigma factor (sigma-70 family)
MKDNTRILEMIQRAKNGDQNAYTTLLNTFWKDVYRFQFSKSNDENEAEDITIKTFARAFDKLNTYDEQYSFKNWLITISANIFVDHTRLKKAETVSIGRDQDNILGIVDEEPSPADLLIIEQNLSRLKSFIKQLKPHYQQVINLRYFQDLSYKEIAEILNEPMSNVKVKLLRAKKILSELILTNES